PARTIIRLTPPPAPGKSLHPTMGPLSPHGPEPFLTSTGPLRGANIGCADVIGCAGSPFHPARGPSAAPDPRSTQHGAPRLRRIPVPPSTGPLGCAGS